MVLVKSGDNQICAMYAAYWAVWRGAHMLGIALCLGCSQGESEFEGAISDVKGERYEKAAPVLEVEARQGNQVARIILAKLYASGLGVPRDATKARGLLSCAGQEKCVPGKSEFYLALEFYEGVGVAKDIDSAIYWMKASADSGYYPASQWLAKNVTSTNAQ